MQLCPQGAAAWRGNPRLPSRACKFSSALTAKAYGAAGQAASALHAMALLQVHQAKALKQLHEGDADPGVLQELRTATDLALRATKVTARALGQTMSTLLVQERHLWLTLADMRESDKHRFLDSPISQAGLFGGGLCPTVLRRTEADGGVSSHPAPAVRCCLHPTAGCSPSVCSSPRAPSCCLHLHSSSATTAACTTAAAWSWPKETSAARLRPCQAREAPGQAASLRRATRSLWILLFRRWWPHHSFPRRRAGWRIFCFLLFCSATDPRDKDAPVLRAEVATRPPSPPLESEASEVASCRSCPRRAQPCSRRALTSARPSGRMATPPRGTPADLETLRGRSGRPVCLPGHVSLPVVFLPVRGDPRYRCAGMQLASGLMQICVSPSEPSRTDPVQGQGGRGASPLGGALLAQPDVVSGTDAPRDSPSFANSSEEGSTFSERGHPLAPAPRLVESPRMVLGRDAEVLSGLPPAVVNTIASARALSTRQAYRLKWNLFVNWCSPRWEDPRRCPIAVVLSFLQDGLERRLSPSTLKVYVAAIAAHHDAVDGKSLGRHDLVIRFLRGARRLNPPRPHLVPSWDLPSVLSALRGAPFEPLQSVELKFLSLKTVLLSALATVKRVGDLQAFSVDDSCLEFGPADSHVVLRPRPGYVPKVPTMPFRDQVVNLQALPREEADPAIALLCTVRALRIYVDRTQSFKTSDQLFVCFGGQQKGKAVSKQRLAHWIVEAIVLAYQARRLPCPLGVRAHSTRGVASSWALARGASIADICKAAGWATPNTFARFYNLRIEPVSSRVLVSDGQ